MLPVSLLSVTYIRKCCFPTASQCSAEVALHQVQIKPPAGCTFQRPILFGCRLWWRHSDRGLFPILHPIWPDSRSSQIMLAFPQARQACCICHLSRLALAIALVLWLGMLSASRSISAHWFNNNDCTFQHILLSVCGISLKGLS